MQPLTQEYVRDTDNYNNSEDNVRTKYPQCFISLKDLEKYNDYLKGEVMKFTIVRFEYEKVKLNDDSILDKINMLVTLDDENQKYLFVKINGTKYQPDGSIEYIPQNTNNLLMYFSEYAIENKIQYNDLLKEVKFSEYGKNKILIPNLTGFKGVLVGHTKREGVFINSNDIEIEYKVNAYSFFNHEGKAPQERLEEYDPSFLTRAGAYHAGEFKKFYDKKQNVKTLNDEEQEDIPF